MENEVKTVKLYCAKCQTLEDHTYTVDSNGDLIITCTGNDCGRFLKLPAHLSNEEHLAFAIEHQTANEGQVSLQGSIDALDTLVASLNEAYSTQTVPVDTTPDNVEPQPEPTVVSPEVVEPTV